MNRPFEICLPKSLSLLRRHEFPKKLGLMERLFGRTLARHGTAWVACWNNVRWKLDLTDPSHRWIVYGKYEGGLGLNFAAETLRAGGVYVDSGANIGQWLLYLGGISGVRTLAFEPVDSQRNWLKECVAGQPGWKVEIFDCGLGAAAGELEIQCDGSRSTLRMDWYQGKALATQRIQLAKLSDVLNAARVETVTLWKLDVEGAELDAIKGAESYLRDQRIKNIFFECHPSNYEAIKSLFGSWNYGVYDLTRKGLEVKVDERIEKTENLVARPFP